MFSPDFEVALYTYFVVLIVLDFGVTSLAVVNYLELSFPEGFSIFPFMPVDSLAELSIS